MILRETAHLAVDAYGRQGFWIARTRVTNTHRQRLRGAAKRLHGETVVATKRGTEKG